MIVIIDNYDSFTYNLVQYAGTIDPDLTVVRNDSTGVKGIAALDPAHIILSPGPGRPADAGICTNVVRELGRRVPILGVCLGHQCVGEAFGARVVRAPFGLCTGRRPRRGSSGPARSFRPRNAFCRALPFAGGGARFAPRRTGRGRRDRRQRRDGGQARELSGVRRPVPPRVAPDRTRFSDHAKLLSYRGRTFINEANT